MLISLRDTRRVADMLLLDLVQNLKTVCIAEKNIVQGKAMISYYHDKCRTILFGEISKASFLKYSEQTVRPKQPPNEQSKLYTSHGRTSAKYSIFYIHKRTLLMLA